MRVTSGSRADLTPPTSQPLAARTPKRTRWHGRSRHRVAGTAGLAFVMVIAGLALGGLLLMPSRIQHQIAERSKKEELVLKRLVEGYRESIREELSIPGAANWASAVAKAGSANPTMVNSVDPKFPDDTTLQRVFLVDPRLGSGVLPYTQTTAGLTGAQTNLIGDYARVMIVSCTKRGLTLPVTSGTPTTTAFDALWSWSYNPSTKAPPSGWPSSWTGNGHFLHVARIPLSDLFAEVTLDNVRYGLELGTSTIGSLAASSLTTVPVTLLLLKGSTLAISQTNGVGYQIRVVTDATGFSFAPTNTPTQALAYFPFTEANGSSRVINGGTYGSAWDGWPLWGANLGYNGPRPPTYTGLPTNNLAIDFNGSSGLVYTTGVLPARLREFTLAGWVRPQSISRSTRFAFGVYGVLNMNLTQSCGRNYIRASTKRSGDLRARYDYSLDTWHHVAVVGTGNSMSLYLDGTLRATSRKCVSNYAYTDCRRRRTFMVGGYGLYGCGNFDGLIDEVILFDKALTATQIADLYHGDTTLSSLAPAAPLDLFPAPDHLFAQASSPLELLQP